MNPRLSVIIPTHNRCEILPRTLGALARQTAPSENFEVIVVADGCKDQTRSVVKSLRVPYTLRIIEQPASGAAAARNRGADASGAPVLLFLDDDMEADPTLIAAHLRAHQADPGGVAVGYFRPSGLGRSDHLPTVMTNLWWAERFAEMARHEYRYTAMDLFTGNVSMPREAFIAAGKFDEAFHQLAGEDYELGVRLIKQGARFCLVRDASSTHHDVPTAERSFKRAYAEGRGHVLIARKHPEMCPALPLRWLLSEPLPPALWPWLRPGTLAAVTFPYLLLPPLRIAEALKLRQLWRIFQGLLHQMAYWRGAVEAMGGWAAVERFVQEMPLYPQVFNELEVDLQTQLPQLEQLLASRRVDALCMRYGKTPIGRIAPVAGAEALRLPHVRHAIVHWFGYNFMIAVRRNSPEAATAGVAGVVAAADALIEQVQA